MWDANGSPVYPEFDIEKSESKTVATVKLSHGDGEVSLGPVNGLMFTIGQSYDFKTPVRVTIIVEPAFN